MRLDTRESRVQRYPRIHDNCFEKKAIRMKEGRKGGKEEGGSKRWGREERKDSKRVTERKRARQGSRSTPT